MPYQCDRWVISDSETANARNIDPLRQLYEGMYIYAILITDIWWFVIVFSMRTTQVVRWQFENGEKCDNTVACRTVIKHCHENLIWLLSWCKTMYPWRWRNCHLSYKNEKSTSLYIFWTVPLTHDMSKPARKMFVRSDKMQYICIYCCEYDS